MGGLDSVEVCELVSIFLFNQMENVLPQELLELFREDGIGATDLPVPALDRLRKEIIRVFQMQRNGLKINAETGMKVKDFLDITLNLENSSFRAANQPHTSTKTPTIPCTSRRSA
jgi:hypothetical protein